MLHIEFYKKVTDFWGKSHMEKVEFYHDGDIYSAYDEAVKRGHNPNKNIRWREV